MKPLFAIVKGFIKNEPDNPWALVAVMITILLIAAFIISSITSNQNTWPEHK